MRVFLKGCQKMSVSVINSMKGLTIFELNYQASNVVHKEVTTR